MAWRGQLWRLATPSWLKTRRFRCRADVNRLMILPCRQQGLDQAPFEVGQVISAHADAESAFVVRRNASIAISQRPPQLRIDT